MAVVAPAHYRTVGRYRADVVGTTADLDVLHIRRRRGRLVNIFNSTTSVKSPDASATYVVASIVYVPARRDWSSILELRSAEEMSSLCVTTVPAGARAFHQVQECVNRRIIIG